MQNFVGYAESKRLKFTESPTATPNGGMRYEEDDLVTNNISINELMSRFHKFLITYHFCLFSRRIVNKL